MLCQGTNRDGSACRSKAVKGELCFIHDQIARAQQEDIYACDPVALAPEPEPYQAQIFTAAPAEIDTRIRQLTKRQKQALEHLCNGETYEQGAAMIGITDASFTVRISRAMNFAGCKNRYELIALYATWRVQNGKVPMA